MINLETPLAQEIVERTMRVIPFNVNVMDVRGVILGSGNPSRIGELHAGARLALAQSRAVELDTALTRSLQGARPGVNLPLTVRGQPCGVVGITGNPDEVRQFGELVRVMAEMILEQAQLVSELQHEKRYREEFVDQLVKQGATSRADLEIWGSRLGVDFRVPRSAVVLELIDEAISPDLAMAELQRCQQQLAKLDSELLMAAVSPRELVILKTFPPAEDDRKQAVMAQEQLFALDTAARQGLKTPAALSLGVALTGIEGVPLSYQCAKRTFRVGRVRNRLARLFSYYDLSFPVLLSGLGSGWQAQQLLQPLRRLQDRDRRSGSLRKTIGTWFSEDCQADRTARKLGIHRNTLDYRLRQISEITGLDLGRMNDRLMLYAALQLE